MKVLVTGAAGFIGSHLTRLLLDNGFEVVGLDNLNAYYDPRLKKDRLGQLGIDSYRIKEGRLVASKSFPDFRFVKADLCDKPRLDHLFVEEQFDAVVNLAAQAGVRHSISHPYTYIESNITGFLNILEACRNNPVQHLVFASSSSVYGANTNMPFSVKDNVDHPLSLYAASKKSNELMAHTYANLYGVPTTGLRFFTVYGPWGRPDMALFLFTEAMLKGEAINVFNRGDMERDFTYVSDIVESIRRLIPKPPAGNESWSDDRPDPSSSFAPYQLFNIGHNKPVRLMDFIGEIEKQLGLQAEKNLLPMQPGDVRKTWADVSDLFEYIDYKPQVGVKEGIRKFLEWYSQYYHNGKLFAA